MREPRQRGKVALRRWFSSAVSIVVLLLCVSSLYLHLANSGGAFQIINQVQALSETGKPRVLGSQNWCDELGKSGRLRGEVRVTEGPLVGGPYYGLFQTDEANQGLRLEMGPTGKVALVAPASAPAGMIRVAESLRPIQQNEVVHFLVSTSYLLIRGNGWSTSIAGDVSPLCGEVRVGTNYDGSRAYPGEVSVTFKSERFVTSDQTDRQVMIIFCLAAFLLSVLWLGRRTSRAQLVCDNQASAGRIDQLLHQTAVFLVLLTPFVLVTLGRVWTVSDGWFMSWWKGFQKDSIYSDISFPYPPASLVEGFVPLLSDRIFLTEQIYHFVTWSVFCVASFKLASEVAKKSIAFFVTVMLAAVYFAMPFNFISGYFELALTMLLLGLAIFPRDEKGSNRATLSVAISAMCFVTAALTKQTFALVPLALTFYLLRMYRAKKLTGRSFASWMFGLSLPVSLVLAWTVINGNFLDFLRNILSGGGKGDVASGLIERVVDWGILRAINGTSLSVFIYLVPLCVLLLVREANLFDLRDEAGSSSTNSRLPIRRIFKAAELILLLLTIWSLLSVSAPGQMPVYGHLLRIIALALVAISVANEFTGGRLLRFRKCPEHDHRWSSNKPTLLFGCLSLALAYLAVRLSRGQSLESFEKSGMFSGLSQTMTTTGVLTAVFLLFTYLATITFPIERNIIVEIKNRTEWQALRSLKISMALITALLIPVLNSLSGWTTFETWYVLLLLILPIFVGLLTRGRSLLVVLVCLTYFVSLAASAIEPYQWWGLRVPPLSQARAEPPSRALSGFLLDTDTVQYLTEVRRISKAAANDQSATAFYGPQNVGLQFVLEIDALSTKCLVMWWDVCSIKDQESTVQKVKTTKPDFIFWNVPPGAVATGHDAGFNTGESVTSRAPEILGEMIAEGAYVERADLAIPGSDGWSTLVLERRR